MLNIRYVFILLIRQLVKLFYLVPIDKKKVIFISFNGKQFSCNPLYIYQELERVSGDSIKYIWIAEKSNQRKSINGKSIRVIRASTYSYIYHMLSAAAIITNNRLPSFLPIRKSQLLIDTWHGGGLFKNIDGRADGEMAKYVERMDRLHSSQIKLYTSSSLVWNEQIAKNRFRYCGEILNCGMARNDLFFKQDKDLVDKVKKILGVPNNDSFVLYAPTYRQDRVEQEYFQEYIIDTKRCVDALEQKFGKKFHFVFRGHHLMKADEINGVIDASNYPDMQELLYSADVFISDYSSCLWDFSLTFRPSFIFAADFEKYSITPGFESDYAKWPFSIAKDNAQLFQNITEYSEISYKEKCTSYHIDYGSYERGEAARKISNYIISKIQ